MVRILTFPKSQNDTKYTHERGLSELIYGKYDVISVVEVKRSKYYEGGLAVMYLLR